MAIADGSKTGRTDPAFEAHMAVTHHWAMAVWNSWLPFSHLEAALESARVRTAKGARPWAVVYGPAAALLCSLDRIGWVVKSAKMLVTDEGRTLNLEVDPRQSSREPRMLR